jgi:hypothetical protein
MIPTTAPTKGKTTGKHRRRGFVHWTDGMGSIVKKEKAMAAAVIIDIVKERHPFCRV